MSKLIVLSLLLLITAPFAAMANDTSTSQQEQQIVGERLAWVNARLAPGSKLGGEERAKLISQRRAIQGLIQRLEAGEVVDPKEVDRLVGRRQQPPYIERLRPRSFNARPKQEEARVVEARQPVYLESPRPKPFGTPPKQR